MDGIGIAVVTGALCCAVGILINAFVRRLGVQTRTDRLEDAVKQNSNALKVMAKCHDVTLALLQGEDLNGEVKKVREELRDHWIDK